MTGIDKRKPLAERKTKNIGRLTLLAFLLLAVWVPALFGQTAATGALTGTVTDAQGAVIGGATITATNTDTNQAEEQPPMRTERTDSTCCRRAPTASSLRRRVSRQWKFLPSP